MSLNGRQLRRAIESRFAQRLEKPEERQVLECDCAVATTRKGAVQERVIQIRWQVGCVAGTRQWSRSLLRSASQAGDLPEGWYSLRHCNKNTFLHAG